MSIILNTDSYKLFHWKAYPPKTENVYSYAESRGGKYEETLFFGLQAIIKENLLKVPTLDEIAYAKEFSSKHGLPYNEQGWLDINALGYIPVEIKAVPEGSIIPTKNVLVTVENTDNRFPWLTSYLETMLLRIWYPITVATRIYNMKKKIKSWYDQTSDVGINPFSLLDFSSRGCSSFESNQLGGAAYLTLFQGSDSIPAVDYVNRLYNSEMSGFSVPATEHSVTTSWGPACNEHGMIAHLLDNTPDGGIISMVGDTYDIFKFTEKLAEFKDTIVERKITVVVRPDSGEIEDVLPEVLKIVKGIFGGVTNSKGFTVLNNCKVLWGDGINEDTCDKAFKIALSYGISADSIMVGSGGGLMQANIDRDTCKFAFKASNVTIDGVDYHIAKDPITDPGKRSKKGRMILYNYGGKSPFTYTEDNHPIKYEMNKNSDMLKTVFRDGELLIDENIEVIRGRISI